MSNVALITGASSGIGKAAALDLLACGWIVYAGARRIEKMADLAQKGIHVISLDVTQDDSMVACINKIIAEQGRIDALVNNAGYGSYGSLEDLPMEEARRQVEVNVFGLARLTQLALPHMRAQNRGRIINVSSIGGSFGEPHGAWYHGTKWAVEGISDSLRMEVKQFGIDVSIIKPGAILTEWGDIARKKLLEVSGHTAYGALARKHAAMLERFDGQGSDPSVVSRAIIQACTARRPKTRYVIGRASGTMMFMRRMLSDRSFDAMLMSQMK